MLLLLLLPLLLLLVLLHPQSLHCLPYAARASGTSSEAALPSFCLFMVQQQLDLSGVSALFRLMCRAFVDTSCKILQNSVCSKYEVQGQIKTRSIQGFCQHGLKSGTKMLQTTLRRCQILTCRFTQSLRGLKYLQQQPNNDRLGGVTKASAFGQAYEATRPYQTPI